MSTENNTIKTETVASTISGVTAAIGTGAASIVAAPTTVVPLAIAVGAGCLAGYAASKAWDWLMD